MSASAPDATNPSAFRQAPVSAARRRMGMDFERPGTSSTRTLFSFLQDLAGAAFSGPRRTYRPEAPFVLSIQERAGFDSLASLAQDDESKAMILSVAVGLAATRRISAALTRADVSRVLEVLEGPLEGVGAAAAASVDSGDADLSKVLALSTGTFQDAAARAARTLSFLFEEESFALAA